MKFKAANQKMSVEWRMNVSKVCSSVEAIKMLKQVSTVHAFFISRRAKERHICAGRLSQEFYGYHAYM
jgi:hypothetical protein